MTDVEELLRRASQILLDDGIPVERCVLSRKLVIESAAEIESLRKRLAGAGRVVAAARNAPGAHLYPDLYDALRAFDALTDGE